jgi:hypothetical protein
MTAHRLGGSRRRSVAADSSLPRSYSWPEYLVSAPHRLPAGRVGDLPRPYGVRHARRVGSLQTACGRPAVTWPYFWDLSFNAPNPDRCPACVKAVIELHRASAR